MARKELSLHYPELDQRQNVKLCEQCDEAFHKGFRLANRVTMESEEVDSI